MPKISQLLQVFQYCDDKKQYVVVHRLKDRHDAESGQN